jgi:hypothetical protein
MFKPGKSDIVVVSTPTKTTDILKGFEESGFNMKSITLNDITMDGIQG